MIKMSKRVEYCAPQISVIQFESEGIFAQSFGEPGQAGIINYDSEENDIEF